MKIILWIILGAYVIWCVRHGWRVTRTMGKIHQRLASRRPLTDDEFYNHFKGEGIPLEVVVKVRRILQEETGEDYTRARADDRLYEDLGIGVTDGLEWETIFQELERELGFQFREEEIYEQVQTLGDLIRCVARQVQGERKGKPSID